MDTKKLRQKILDLAIRGKLVPQDPNDEPASVLLERIKEEKERLIKEGKIKKSKKTVSSDTYHYENVPFKVPEVWVWTTLGEILELVSGQDFPPEKYNANIAGIPYIIGASNIENEQLIINRWTESPSVYSYLNDLLVVCKGAGVGKMAINNIGVAHIARQIQAVRGYTNYTDIKYIKAVVKNNIENIISKANGLIPGLKRELLLSLQLPLPPISEQRRIVCEIERWFFLIDQIEQGKADLQTVIKQAKSKILDLAIHGKLVPQNPNDEPAIELLKRINPDFTPCDNRHYTQLPNGWAVCRLDQVADVLDNLRKPINSNERNLRIKGKQIDRLYPYYGATGQVGLIDDYIVDGHYLLLGEDGAPFLDKNAIKAYSISGKSWVNNHVHILSPKIDFEFLQYSLNQIDYSEYVNGSTRLKLTQTDMCSIRLMLPPLSEQKLIKAKIQTLFSQLDMIMGSL
ncbi:restriction endonuclease subunit S [Bacteroides ovatus]|jgi:type I restriction enzyme S subunit|uniref:restriction endonuclease subunit S n=1 Tax=Bacteroides ovatus TaxID=28116 RepID=UPI002164EFC8|nr:restriction endonuclease subunit S [Bacteroides ovatus]MCS2474131.1 restriction endonuclease subunit S [Bacteroides ovatus]MCS3102700.1 restriction endonuclease subunit S [Bacteroides ovatus]UVQ67099.1 restriction endonuclease subunit S [Bacteroides ovatus]